jgi:hypothetical protein
VCFGAPLNFHGGVLVNTQDGPAGPVKRRFCRYGHGRNAHATVLGTFGDASQGVNDLCDLAAGTHSHTSICSSIAEFLGKSMPCTPRRFVADRAVQHYTVGQSFLSTGAASQARRRWALGVAGTTHCSG